MRLTDIVRPTKNLMNDLNVLNVQMNKLFSLIYKHAEHTESKTWSELFVSASTSDEHKKVIAKSIEKLGLTFEDLKALQKLRRLRNHFAHPKVPLSVARVIVATRWNEHESYDALVKMLEIITESSPSSSKALS